MADYKLTDTELTLVANAIRTKGGTQNQLEWPTGFANAIAAIPSGGGGGGVSWESYTPRVYAGSYLDADSGALIKGSIQWSDSYSMIIPLDSLSGKMIRIKNTGDRNYWQIFGQDENGAGPLRDNGRKEANSESIFCVDDLINYISPTGLHYLGYYFTTNSGPTPLVDIADVSALY